MSDYDSGYTDGVCDFAESFRITLHKRVMDNRIIYVDDIIQLLEKVQYVLCEEANSSQSNSTHS
jgi:hypothetical protein